MDCMHTSRQLPRWYARDVTTQTVVVVGDFGGSLLEERTRTSSSGNVGVRYTLSVKTDPVLANLSEVDLGRGPALAIADLIRRQMRDIGETAKPSTLARRKRAVGELARGEAAAVNRYDGGRTGRTPPDVASVRVYNDSGRLRNGIHVMQNLSEGAWTINIPANRLDPTTFGPGFLAMVQRLVRLVPALAGGEAVIGAPEVVKAIADAAPVKLLREWKTEIAKIYGRAAVSGFRTIAGALR